MADIHPGDLVIAVPIGECSIGHPAWHDDFNDPRMDRKSYLVSWTGHSPFGKRPMIGVAGRSGHFCAGCFVKQAPPALPVRERSEPAREPAFPA